MSSYTRQEWRIDGEGKNHFLGSPNRGGLCYRVCLAEWDQVGEDGTAEVRGVVLPNVAYFLVDDIPFLIDLGVDTIKIQGRELGTAVDVDMDGARVALMMVDVRGIERDRLEPWKER